MGMGMGYVWRVRVVAFMAGAGVASALGIYALYSDYINVQQSLSQQVIGSYQSLEGRISVLEKSQEVEATKPVEAAP